MNKTTFSEIADLLRSLDDDLLFVPNSGNAGDSLIAEATYQFLARNGLPYSVAYLDQTIDADQTVVIGGGGNFNGQYKNVHNFLMKHFDSFKRLVILPHTIRGDPALLGRMDERFTLICREDPSYRHCVQYAPNAQVLLSDDMALNWQLQDTIAADRATALSEKLEPSFAYRRAKHEIRLRQFAGRRTSGTLNAFRVDVESRTNSVPDDNVDLSEVFATESMSRKHSASAVRYLARFLEPVTHVKTDRLHISIISALLGKTVSMYDNNYGKNSSVYDNSLRDRFPNITFVTNG